MHPNARPDACAAAHAQHKEKSEKSDTPVTCRPVSSEAELLEVYAIRRAVFVEEQKIFDETDRDSFDEIAETLVAEKDEEIVGAVRLHKESETVWRGSRLAVLNSSRGCVGAALVLEAIDFTARHGADLLVADIQEQCLGLFLKLGWEVVGPGPLIGGVAHFHVKISPTTAREDGGP